MAIFLLSPIFKRWLQMVISMPWEADHTNLESFASLLYLYTLQFQIVPLIIGFNFVSVETPKNYCIQVDKVAITSSIC